MAHFHNNALIGASGQGGYQIERSLRFNSADSAYLNRTPASAGNRRTFTWSGWFKVGNHSSSGEYYLLCTNGTADNTFFYIQIRNNQLRLGSYNSGSFGLFSTQLFRDPSAWYHLVVAVDTTQATAANRAKAYVNGTEITTWSTANYPSQNYDLGANDARAHAVGAGYASGSPYAYWDGLLTEYYLIDGQALTPSSFGETDTITGVWKPKRYAGTYGTNGFKLTFSDNSGTTSTTLGKDSSPNGNNFTPNNFSVTAGAGNDSLIDVPTPYSDGGNGRGNYCTLNPLDSTATLSNGNLTQTATAERNSRSTFQIPSSGLWYAEATATSTTNGSTVSCGFGIATASANLSANPYNLANVWNLYSSNFAYINRNGTPTASLGYTLTAGDVIQIAVDPANNRAWIGRNNTWYNNTTGTTGDPAGGTNPTVSSLPAGLFIFANTFNQTFDVNFGQRPFAYTPPSGFLALNTQNLPEPSIKKPSSYFNTVLWTGNTSTAGVTQAITGVGFASDFVWAKTRNQVFNHFQYDSVRGVGSSGKLLQSNTTAAELTNGEIDSLDADGFTVKYVNTNTLNWSSSNNVAWCWKKSATPGFDIVTYTGNGTSQNIAHSLGVAPSMIVLKKRTGTISVAASSWIVYHPNLTNPQQSIVYLNLTNAQQSDPTLWNNTAPTSTVFSVGNTSLQNESAATYVAYLWSEVAGFSKFGSYTGNGSSDGPFVFCGFRPRWVMFKCSSSTEAGNANWHIQDSSRNAFNISTASGHLFADLSIAEDTNPAYKIDFVSNGFKLRTGDVNYGQNNNGNTYIFAAFAETAFRYSLAR